MNAATVELPSRERRVHPAYWVVSITLAAVLLYWSLKGIEWPRVAHILGTAKLSYVAATALLSSGALFLRAYRWRILLNAEGRVSVLSAFWATSGGYFGNMFLPARAGELVRTMMISGSSNLRKSFVLTTALAERMADAIALVLISACVLVMLPSKPAWLAGAARVFGVIGGCGVMAIVLIPKLERFWKHLMQLLHLPASLQARIAGLLHGVCLGLRSFHDAGRVLAFVAFTIVIWCMDAAFTVIGGAALGLTIDIGVAFLLIAGLGLGSAIPSTPGYVGVYQFIAVTILVPFGLSRTDAIAYILFSQATVYAVMTFWGVLAITQVRRGDRNRTLAAADTVRG